MTSLSGILNIGRQALFASQYMIQVTGNNIANVNTKGFTRQRVNLSANQFGLGVKIDSLQRLRNSFFDEQRILGMQALGNYEIRSNMLSQVEEIFNESTTDKLSASIGNFFQTLQDLSSNPSGSAERGMVVSQADSMTDFFNLYYTQLEALQKNADNDISDTVTQINSIAVRIAELNGHIGYADAAFPPAELIDERNQLLGELANLVDVNYFTDDGGSVTVFIGGGFTLVEGANTGQLSTVINPSNKGFSDVYFATAGGTQAKINDRIRDGRLKGLLDTRDTIIPEQLKKLDTLAATMILNFNLQHRQGFGLDGVDDRDFFDMMSVFAQDSNSNTGGAAVAASSIDDATLLTLDDYEIRFLNATTYDIVDVTTGTTLVAGAAYTSGNAIIFDGISVTITDGSGTPLAGDVFNVDTTTEAAKLMSVSSGMVADAGQIAAGLTAVVGDNENALALAGLEDQKFLNSGISDFNDYLSAQISSIGALSRQAEQQFETQEGIVNQIEAYIDSISGVSLDEEAANLMMYQRAFQASALIITTIDEMFQTILDLKR